MEFYFNKEGELLTSINGIEYNKSKAQETSKDIQRKINDLNINNIDNHNSKTELNRLESLKQDLSIAIEGMERIESF